jgi:hypothetical protein
MATYWKQILAMGALVASATGLAFAGDDLKPEDVLARHLDSIGTRETRGGVKSRVVEGVATYRLLVGGSGAIDGKAVLASEGRKAHILLKVATQGYRGEQFIWNGDKGSVAGTYTDKTRSEFGEFLLGQDGPLREGLLGGVLNTTWPLLDLDARKAKLGSQGVKNIEGRRLIALTYKPKKSTDLAIVLYFDPETFHHVMTVYSVSRAAGLGRAAYQTSEGPEISYGATETLSARQNESRYRLEEKFSDFKVSDGLSLPSHYDLRFTEELQSGFVKTVEWEVTTTRVVNNLSLDPKNFEIH